VVRRLEETVRRHLDWVAAAVSLAGLALRWRLASESYLNPDEAWVSLLAVPSSLPELYAMAIRTAHPPLLVFLVHAVKQVSHAEIALRLAPLIAGAVFPWLVYRWLGRIWSRTAGFIALVLLTLSPSLIALSAQVRGYTLVMLWMAAALLLLERAIKEDSPVKMAGFTAVLYLAILTEYSAAMFAAPVGVYALLRFRRTSRATAAQPEGAVRGVSRITMLAWLGGQAGAALLYAGLFFSQIAPRLERARTSGEFQIWLEPLFPRPGENPLLFLGAGAAAQMRYFLHSEALAMVGIVLWLGGCVLLWRKSWAVAIVMLLPFGLTWAAALLHVHPYTGTRHSAFLALFLAGGIAVAADRLAGSRFLPAALCLVVALHAWGIPAARLRGDMPAENQRKHQMREALLFLKGAVPRDAVLLTETETRQILGHYLAGMEWLPETKHLPSEEQIGPLRTLAARWSYNHLGELEEDVELYRGRYRPAAGESIWVMDAGFSCALGRSLNEERRGFRTAGVHQFGEGILILEIRN
jgi:hypothetical protein